MTYLKLGGFLVEGRSHRFRRVSDEELELDKVILAKESEPASTKRTEELGELLDTRTKLTSVMRENDTHDPEYISHWADVKQN